MISYISSYDKAVSNSSYTSSLSTSAGDLFKQISNDLGGNGKIITKDQVVSYVSNSQSTSSGDSTQTDFLNNLLSKWNMISGGSDSITQSDFTDGISYLYHKSTTTSESTSTLASSVTLLGNEEDDGSDDGLNYGGGSANITTSFDALVAAAGGVGGKVTKLQLMDYLQSLMSDSSSNDNSEAIAYVKNILAQFDLISEGDNSITSLTNLADPQDYTTITTAQVTSPVSVKV